MNSDLPIKLELPEHFLEEEVRCEHVVSKEMKKIWVVELDLLNEFIQVCNKYNLQYYVFGGTMLGAVRHQGFIPWDNDVDVIMPREDYDKLLEIGSTVFKHPYFLQTPTTDNGRYFYFWSKLCNSMTTGRGDLDFAARQNCGIFIDIFTLDHIPSQKLFQKCWNKKLHLITALTPFCGGWYVPRKRNFIQKMMRYFRLLEYKLLGSPSAKSLHHKFEKIASKYNQTETDYCSYVNHGCLRQNRIWKTVDWEGYIPYQFEMLTVNVPKGYNAILKVHYGDYMQLPPVSQRECHEYYDFDPEMPYFEYFAKKGIEYKNIEEM